MGAYLEAAERDFAQREKAGTKTLIPPEPDHLSHFSPHHADHLNGTSVMSLQRLAGNRAVTSLLRPTVQRGCGCGGGCGGSCGGGTGGAQEEKEPETAVSRLAIQRQEEEEEQGEG